MSRKGKADTRIINDFYTTPLWIIENFLQWADTNYHMELFRHMPIKILDPCAGGDFANTMPYPVALKTVLQDDRLYELTTNDIRPHAPTDHLVDFLSDDIPYRNNEFDMVITNPPYLLAMDFIKRGLQVVRKHGYVAYLLRINFFGSDRRKEWLQANMPEWCVVSSKRPSFCKICPKCKSKYYPTTEICSALNCQTKLVKGSDATEYAHFVWKKGYHPEYTKTVVI